MSQSHLSNRMVHGGAWLCLALGLCFLLGGWSEAPALRQVYLGAGEASATLLSHQLGLSLGIEELLLGVKAPQRLSE